MYGAQLTEIETARQGEFSAVAQALGRAYRQYRPMPSSFATGVLDGAPIATVPIFIERTTTRSALENQIFELVFFTAKGDNRTWQLGDLFVEQATGAAYCYCQSRPIKPSFFIRCEALATIRRPDDVATATPTPPPAGTAFVAPTESETDDADDDILTLTGGIYGFSAASTSPTAATVPIGIQPTARARGEHGEKLDSSTAIQRFVGYVPPLGNLRLRERDTLALATGDSYMCEQVFSTGDVGLVGTTCLLVKIGT